MAEKLRTELTCAICLNLFTQAVTLDCGHSFCRECILQSWHKARVPWTCPLCKASSQPRVLEPTRLLEDLTSISKELLLAFQSHISLDPGTAHSDLIISGDLKSVMLASHWWGLLDNLQEGVECLLPVLGAQSFTSGSHYWEVEVGSKTEWEVGISTGPENDQGIIHSDVLSLACLNMGDQFELWISYTMEDPEYTGPLHRLGIFLHYKEGHLSFYNVTQGCLIYVFPPLTFQGPLRPFFSLGLLQEENQPTILTICPLRPLTASPRNSEGE
uniref:Uncharacterized protein n=1 Tax=Monodelphis domestica TaxID=13616 RepID=F6R2W6_MONDO